MTTIDRAHLRHVGLSLAEVKTVSFLASHGGEMPWYGDNVKAQTRAMIDVLVTKGLVELLVRFGGVTYLRLTDQGRSVATQLDAMSVAPKTEITA